MHSHACAPITRLILLLAAESGSGTGCLVAVEAGHGGFIGRPLLERRAERARLRCEEESHAAARERGRVEQWDGTTYEGLKTAERRRLIRCRLGAR